MLPFLKVWYHLYYWNWRVPVYHKAQIQHTDRSNHMQSLNQVFTYRGLTIFYTVRHELSHGSVGRCKLAIDKWKSSSGMERRAVPLRQSRTFTGHGTVGRAKEALWAAGRWPWWNWLQRQDRPRCIEWTFAHRPNIAAAAAAAGNCDDVPCRATSAHLTPRSLLSLSLSRQLTDWTDRWSGVQTYVQLLGWLAISETDAFRASAAATSELRLLNG